MNIKQTKEGWWVSESDSHISKWVEETGQLQHDNFLPRLACEFIPEDGCVIDCGANIGGHTIAYSNKVGVKGSVIAIEPGEVAFKCLQENIKRFHFYNVGTCNSAISNREEGYKFIEAMNLGGSICQEAWDDAQKTIVLDLLCNLCPIHMKHGVDFIKIDCEGWERKILEGGRKLIERCKPSMMIEMNFHALKAQNSSYGEIFDLLSQWGYEWVIAQPECIITDPQWDLIAWHPTKKTYDHKEFLAKNR